MTRTDGRRVVVDGMAMAIALEDELLMARGKQ